jgi:type IV pilus assembly protein PilM
VGLFGKINSPVGLDISGNTIRVAQLKPYSPKPVIIKYGEVAVTQAVKDGEIIDVDMVAKAIQDLWRTANITERRVVLGISNQKVIVRLISLPFMSEDELKSAIEFQAQDHIPIPVEEAILDFQVVGEFTNEDNEKMMEVVLVAAQKDMVTNQMKALEKAKLRPYVVDLSSFALVRSLLEKPPIVPEDKEIEKAKKAVGIVNIGEEITNIVISENYIPRFTRVTSVADESFTKAIADNMAVDLAEAQRFKDDFGFQPVGKTKQKKLKKSEQEKADKVRSILDEEAIRFVSELKRSFDYALSESLKSEKIDRIIISGFGSTVPNLADQIKESFRCTIEMGNPTVSVSSDSQKEFEEKSTNYSISVGLALRGLEE